MKLLIGVSLLVVSTVTVGLLTTGLMKGSEEELSETVHTSSDLTSPKGSQGEGSNDVNKEVVRNTADTKPTLNLVSLNQNKQSSDFNQNNEDLLSQNNIVNKSNSNDLKLNNEPHTLVAASKHSKGDLPVKPSNAKEVSATSSVLEGNQPLSDTKINQKLNVVVAQSNLVNDPSSKVSNLQESQQSPEAVINQNSENIAAKGIAKIKSRTNTVDESLYGNQNQSGNRVHQAINDLVLEGTPLNIAISNVIEQAIEDETSTLLSSTAFYSVSQYKEIALGLMSNILASNDLITASKLLIENKPVDVMSIVNVSVALYPDFAQEVINAATMTGEIDPNEALLAAIAAGADPSTVSEATAAGGGVVDDFGALPFAGLGGGGSGDQEVSASNN
jgi:hypothetical protein